MCSIVFRIASASWNHYVQLSRVLIQLGDWTFVDVLIYIQILDRQSETLFIYCRGSQTFASWAPPKLVRGSWGPPSARPAATTLNYTTIYR